MRDEPTYKNEPHMDPQKSGGDPGSDAASCGDVAPAELSPIKGRESEKARGDAGSCYELATPVDLRGPFLDWFVQQLNTVEVSGDRERAPWCPEWWLHPEVNARLWALYMAWIGVEASESVAALSDWWLNHWDRHRSVLFDGQTGPFRECDPTRGHLANRMRDQDRKIVTVTLPPDEWRPPSG